MQANIRMKRCLAVSGLGVALALTATAQSVTTTVTEGPGSYCPRHDGHGGER